MNLQAIPAKEVLEAGVSIEGYDKDRNNVVLLKERHKKYNRIPFVVMENDGETGFSTIEKAVDHFNSVCIDGD